MDDTQMEGQINNKERTLVDIMTSLCNMTNSIKGIKQRLNKLEIISNKPMSLKQNTIHLKNNSRKLNQLKPLLVINLKNKEKK